jgi:methyl-accepting chemotaxis protein
VARPDSAPATPDLYVRLGGEDGLADLWTALSDRVRADPEVSFGVDAWLTAARHRVAELLGAPRRRGYRRARAGLELDRSSAVRLRAHFWAAVRESEAAEWPPAVLKRTEHAIFPHPETQKSADLSEGGVGMASTSVHTNPSEPPVHPGEDPRLQALVDAIGAAVSGDLNPPLSVTGDDLVGQVAQRLADLFASLRTDISTTASTSTAIAASADELGAATAQMSEHADRTSTQAKQVSVGAEAVYKNVQTVAAAAEEMAIGVREIAKNASEAARVATGAVEMAQTTNDTITKLGDSSSEIGKVIKVITSIAQQTNLLALNATIEAARAGEAGKGFAVVANEVKELAKETAKATEDISRKIETIQTDTRGAVQAIGQISSIIDQINDFQSSIASAVEQQTATTNEISRSVNAAAMTSEEIARNISAVADAAQGTTRSAHDARQSVVELNQHSSTLQQIVAQFQY